MDVTIPCPCDGSPHETDTITLRDKLDFHRATTITKAIQFIENDDERTRPAEVLATLSEFYVVMGIERWTLRAGNKPLPVTPAAIRERILETDSGGIVAEAADGLYAEAILLPLLARASSSSPPSQTPEQTSPKPSGSRPKRQRPSRRSSISTIPTAGTETTSASPDGVSSSSQNSESAA